MNAIVVSSSSPAAISVRCLPTPPQAGNGPAGGSHAPIPVQGENYGVCAKVRCAMLNEEASHRLDAIDGRLAEIEAQVKYLQEALSELASELAGRSALALGVDAERTAGAKPARAQRDV
jgi:hypothetical protein